MIAALIPQLLPILGGVIEKAVPDENARQKLTHDIERALVANAHQINLEMVKTTQIEAQHRSVFVAGWRPAVGWVLALGLFWIAVGGPFLTWLTAVYGLDIPPIVFPEDLVLEMMFALLGMGALRSFDKLKRNSV